ncbi:peptidoglycan recognition protein family protein [Terrabacter koreensis]
MVWDRGTERGDLSVTSRLKVGNGWQPWGELDVQAGEASDAKAARRAGAPAVRVGTEPIITTGASAYEIRVTTSGTGAKLPRNLSLLDIDGSATPVPTGPSAQAVAEGVRPTILSRAAWGADESMRNCEPTYSAQLKAVAVHHTAGVNGYSESQVPGIINSIYSYHVNGQGWCDVGYNVFVDRFGRLWEGRYGGLDRNVLPAAQGGFNLYTSAISAMGTYDSAAPSSAMREAIAKFASWRLGLAHLDPLGSTVLTTSSGSSRYPAGTSVRLPVIFGHRDTNLTECPGTSLYSVLPSIRSRARALSGSAAIFDPAVNFTRLTHRDLPAFRLNAHTPSWQRFTLTVVSRTTGAVVYSTSGATFERRLSAMWDRRDSQGRPVPAGSYDLRLASSSTNSSATTYVLTVVVMGAPQPFGDRAPDAPVYRTPGTYDTSTHQWRTTCAPYSTATRCDVQIRSSGTAFVRNNWHYHDEGYTSWAGNRLAVTGRWSSGNVAYSTNCTPSASTGPRTCTTQSWNASRQAWVLSSTVWLGDGQ